MTWSLHVIAKHLKNCSHFSDDGGHVPSPSKVMDVDVKERKSRQKVDPNFWSSKVAKSMENPLSVGNCHNYPLPLLISGGCSWLQSHNHDTDKFGIVGICGPYSYGLLAYELEPHPQAVAG